MDPHILLVEDDAVSRAFLGEALAMLPAQVDAAASIASALALAGTKRHSLWLIDAHLPDGSGIDCLLALRRAHPGIPALAITAQALRDQFDAMCAAGFVEVLQKPITVASLLAPVRRTLGHPFAKSTIEHAGKQPAWDEMQALSALGGNPDMVVILRKMFIAELPSQRQRVSRACRENRGDAARDELHKLKASCGFVGAARLLLAVNALSDFPLDPERLAQFEFAVADTLDAHP